MSQVGAKTINKTIQNLMIQDTFGLRAGPGQNQPDAGETEQTLCETLANEVENSTSASDGG